jgi:hypothetical protein
MAEKHISGCTLEKGVVWILTDPRNIP